MPDVDEYRKTPEFEKDRLAIARQAIIGKLCLEIAGMELDMQQKALDERLLLQTMMELWPEYPEINVTPEIRQDGYEKFVTTDDHMMHPGAAPVMS